MLIFKKVLIIITKHTNFGVGGAVSPLKQSEVTMMSKFHIIWT